MSRYLVKKASLEGAISLPSSKSHTLRSILFGALGDGKSLIRHYLPSPDAEAMVEACRVFGANIEVTPDTIAIEGLKGKIRQTEDVIYAGNSGLVLRFCAAIGALASRPVVITGDQSIRHQRPMEALLAGLTQLGASAISMRGDGYAPVIIRGPLQSGQATFQGEDSQPVSALLMAAAFAEGPIELIVRNAGEKPWVALTLNWLDRLGIVYEHHNFERYCLLGRSRYEGFSYDVPGDLSSAAFPIAAALVTHSELLVQNIDLGDCQGDKEIISVWQQMGARFEIDAPAKTLRVKKGPPLKGSTVDINDYIDAITILAVVACYAEGETHIQNAAIAKQKECNRIHCIATELRKMGADVTETEDGLVVRGSRLNGTHLNSHGDHRMAMSLAIAALGAEGESIISPTECVAKTFPSFVRDFHRLGAAIQELS